MKYSTLEDSLLTQLATHITAVVPRPHHTHLLTVINELLTPHHFEFSFTQEGWYRLGGVIRADGTKITEDLEAWAEVELESCAGDMGEFLDRHVKDELLVTRLLGKTHYFVASYGPKPTDFFQLEIEELQEVLDRSLIDPNQLPNDLSELIDPITPKTLSVQAVSRSYYRLRCLIDMCLISNHLTGPDEPIAPLQRFLNEWNSSRTGSHDLFCKHWIVNFHEYVDAYQQVICVAAPFSLHFRQLRYFPWDLDAQGTEMAQQIIAFDRAAGYPFAWYFHLVAGKFPPSEIAFIVKQDLGKGYRYLAEADTVILETWIREPYKISQRLPTFQQSSKQKFS